MARFYDEVSRLALSVRDDVSNFYQHVFLGLPRFPQHQHDPEPEKPSPGLGELWRSTGGSVPPQSPEPAPVLPETPPHDPMAGLKALRIERSDAAEPRPPLGPELGRGGPDFGR